MHAKTSLVLLSCALALSQGIAIGKQPEPAGSQGLSPNNGFVLQTGYEGYIVSPQKPAPSTGNGLAWIAPTLAGKIKLVRSLLLPLSGALLLYGAKIVTMGLHLLLSMALGVAATTALCTLTPICSISLNLPGLEMFKGQSVKEQVAELARSYITPENMEMASQILQSALSKYGTNQRREVEQPATEQQDNNETPHGDS